MFNWNVFALERYRSIVERVSGKGRATVSDLADHLSVTPETIRRDLDKLEQRGLLRRVHGGAVPVDMVGFEASFAEREIAFTYEKMRIAKAAVREISDKSTVIVDSGTSTQYLLSFLPIDIEIQIITNSPTHIQSLAKYPQIELIFLGGRLRKSTSSCVGTWAIEALSRINADLVILGTNGISISKGLTTPDQSESDVKKAMLRAGARKILLADSSKFNQVHFSTFAQIAQIDLIISDTALEEKLVSQVESFGPKLVLA